MLDYLWNVPRDIWIYHFSGETGFFADNIGEFQTIGIALITLLIPLGLSLLQSENKDFPTLDKKAIRIHAVSPIKIVIAILWLIITPLFWGISSNSFLDILILLILIGGVIFILYVLKNMWEWTSHSYSLRKAKRIQFLNILNKKDDWEMKYSVWLEILSKDDLDVSELSYFLDIFMDMIRGMYKSKEREGGYSQWTAMFELFWVNYSTHSKLANKSHSMLEYDFTDYCNELLLREFDIHHIDHDLVYVWGDAKFSEDNMEKREIEIRKFLGRIKRWETKSRSSLSWKKEYILKVKEGKAFCSLADEKEYFSLSDDVTRGCWKKLFEEKQ